MTENKQMQQQLVGELEELKDTDLDAVVGGILTLGFGVEGEVALPEVALPEVALPEVALPTISLGI